MLVCLVTQPAACSARSQRSACLRGPLQSPPWPHSRWGVGFGCSDPILVIPGTWRASAWRQEGWQQAAGPASPSGISQGPLPPCCSLWRGCCCFVSCWMATPLPPQPGNQGIAGFGSKGTLVPTWFGFLLWARPLPPAWAAHVPIQPWALLGLGHPQLCQAARAGAGAPRDLRSPCTHLSACAARASSPCLSFPITSNRSHGLSGTRYGVAEDLVVLGQRVDLVMLEISSNLVDSAIQ